MSESVTNETLAFLLRSQEKRGDERHADNVKRLDEIREQVLATNGRLQKVEKRQATDLMRFGQIQNELELKANTTEIERLEVEIKRKAERGGVMSRPRRELVIKVGLVGAGSFGIWLAQLIWKVLHG